MSKDLNQGYAIWIVVAFLFLAAAAFIAIAVVAA